MPKPDLQRLTQVYTTVLQHPGSTIADLAHLTGHSKPTINCMLTTLETNGFHLSEDKYGRLYPFKPLEPPHALA